MIGGELDQVARLRELFGHCAGDIGDAADAVDVALRRFTTSSTEYVPALPRHAHRADELAERCRDLGRRAEHARDALAAADRWVGTTVAMQTRDAGFVAAGGAVGMQGLWHGRGDVATVRHRRLDRREPQVWGHRDFKRDVLGMEGRRIPQGKEWADEQRAARNARNAAWRAEWRAMTDARDAWAESMTPGAQWVDSRKDVARLRGRLDLVARPDLAAGAAEEGASAWTRGRHVFSNSKVGAVARLGGRAFGAGSIVFEGLDLHRGLREDDMEQVVTSGVAVVAGVAMMFPPTAVAGAVATGGVLVYEHRDKIVAGARHIGDAAVAEVRDRVDRARQAVDAVGDVGRGMLDAATGALGGLFG